MIQKQEDTIMTSHIRTKIRLRQVSDIYCELIKIRDGEKDYYCQIRNMLQIFGGELKLHCSIDVDTEISSLAAFLDKGISISNWDEINDIVLQFYDHVLRKCSVIDR